MELTRVCRKCFIEKPHSLFEKQAGCKFGISHRCRRCKNQYLKLIRTGGEWRTPIRICKVCGVNRIMGHNVTGMCRRCYNIYYKINNKPRLKDQYREWYNRNPNYFRDWANNNRDKLNTKARKYYRLNKSKIIESPKRKEWLLHNLDKIKGYKKKTRVNILINLPNYYIKDLLSRAGFDKEKIPKELIELKRLHLRGKQHLNQI